MTELDEMENYCLRMISEDANSLIPWHILANYVDNDEHVDTIQLDVSDYLKDKIRDRLRNEIDDLEHKYKNSIDKTTLDVIEYPNDTRISIWSLKNAFGSTKQGN